MRTRHRIKDHAATSQHGPYGIANGTTYYCDGSHSTGDSGASTLFMPLDIKYVEERIVDDLGKAQSNNVYHRSISYESPSLVKSYGGNPRIPYAQDPGKYKIHIGYPLIALDLTPFYIRANLSTQGKDSLGWDMGPTMSQNPKYWSITGPTVNEKVIVNDLFDKAKALKADVLLNIVEANQMFPSVKSLANCIPAMARNWRSIRKVLKTASGSYLAWKFGVSPIISDIKSIRKFAPDLNRQFKRFNEAESFRYSRAIPLKTEFTGQDLAYFYAGVNTWRRSVQGRILGPAETRYVLVVKPTVKYKTETFSRLQYVIDRFSSSPASLAWEKVPFSFVLDWFVDLRGSLRELDSLIGFEPYKVVSLTRSTKYAVATDTFLDYRDHCNGSSLLSECASKIEYSHYERVNVVPEVSPQWRRRFGKNQAGISAALIAQKLSAIR